MINEPLAFARWHSGKIEWGDALRSGAIEVTGVAHAGPGASDLEPTQLGQRKTHAARFEPPVRQPEPTTATSSA